MSYRLNVGLGGTYRELYRVLGGSYEGIYYKFNPGLMWRVGEIVVQGLHTKDQRVSFAFIGKSHLGPK